MDAQTDRNTIGPDELIPAQRMLRLLSVSDMTLRRWNAAGHFPDPIAIGARRFWRGRDYLAWLDAAPRRRAVVSDAT